MDHISRALARAQDEKRSVSSWVRPTAIEPRVDEPKVEPKSVVSLREMHLRSRHILCGRTGDDRAVFDRYRLLRTRVLQALRSDDQNTVGVTSPGARDGKSLTSINLAMSIAREGSHRVVLVDADLRKPTIAIDLGIHVDLGLIDYLSRDIDFADVCISTDIENLVIVPGRREEATFAVPELLSSERMRALLARYHGQEQYVVVVDLPPVQLGDDVVALAPYLDGILMVVREGGTPINSLKESVDLLKDYRILGTVLNSSSERRPKFEGYYYGASTERG